MIESTLNQLPCSKTPFSTHVQTSIFRLFLVLVATATGKANVHADFINPILNTAANYYSIEYLYDAHDDLDMAVVKNLAFSPISKQYSFGINHDIV